MDSRATPPFAYEATPRQTYELWVYESFRRHIDPPTWRLLTSGKSYDEVFGKWGDLVTRRQGRGEPVPASAIVHATETTTRRVVTHEPPQP